MYEIFESLLKAKKCKPIDVAKATNIPPSTFSDWKKGKSAPKMDKLQKIADFFGVGIEYFIHGDEKPDSVKEESTPYVTLAASRRDGYDKPLPPDEIAVIEATLAAYRASKKNNKKED